MTVKKNNSIVNSFGRRIQMIRLEAGLTTAEFAKEIFGKNAKGATVVKVEEDSKNIPINLSNKICDRFDIDLEWLLTGKAELKDFDIVRVPGVSDRIKAYREFCGMSKRELSADSGLGNTPQNVTRLENKTHRPRMATIRKLSKVLRVRSTNLAFGAYMA